MIFTAAYLLLLLLITLMNAAGPERWPLSCVNLYLPQWIWAIPGALLLPVTLRIAPGWSWLPLAALLWVAGPILGLRWHPQRPDPPSGPGLRLRVMTYNVKWGKRDISSLVRDVAEQRPDILLLQDSENILQGELGRALAGWNIRGWGQFITASRLPLSEQPISDPWSHLQFASYTLQAVKH